MVAFRSAVGIAPHQARKSRGAIAHQNSPAAWRQHACKVATKVI
ncbi:MAG: hypothetical protein V7K83_29595 [Nostoc sp.]